MYVVIFKITYEKDEIKVGYNLNKNLLIRKYRKLIGTFYLNHINKSKDEVAD